MKIEVVKLKDRKRVVVKCFGGPFSLHSGVYTFAGGHDRADKLTRELAKEIEADPCHQ